jgi:hypothetical protein
MAARIWTRGLHSLSRGSRKTCRKTIVSSAFFAGRAAKSAVRRNPMVVHGGLRYSDHIETWIERKTIMSLIKNMEAVFVVALGLACSATYMLDTLPDAQPRSPAVNASVATPTRVAVVTVSAKRMSSAQKQQSLEEERKLAGLRDAAGSRI